MKRSILLLVIVLILSSCSSYLPLSTTLIAKENLSCDDIKLLQLYSYKGDIVYKGAEIKQTTEGILGGDLYTGTQIERNLIIVDKRTEGAANEVGPEITEYPLTISVLYDEDLPPVIYTKRENDTKYALFNTEMNMENGTYKIQSGLRSKLYIRRDELKELLENKQVAKGIRVDGTKLNTTEELIEQ